MHDEMANSLSNVYALRPILVNVLMAKWCERLSVYVVVGSNPVEVKVCFLLPIINIGSFSGHRFTAISAHGEFGPRLVTTLVSSAHAGRQEAMGRVLGLGRVDTQHTGRAFWRLIQPETTDSDVERLGPCLRRAVPGPVPPT